MPESFLEFFSTGAFMPHGHCYLWKPGLLWLQVISNGAIGLAYVAISVTLVYLIWRGREIPFQKMALAFGVFIVTCGITHFFDIYVIWEPAYWLDGAIRAVTAGASVMTAALLPPLVPKAITLARGAHLARQRGVELEQMVDDLGKLYQRTRELDLAKTQFFANVSHELRTPLALIIGPVERLLSADNLTPEQRRELQVVLRNGRTLSKHVDDLLEIARAESSELSLSYSEADVSRLVRQVAAHFDGLAEQRHLTFTVDTPTRILAQIDQDKVRRVLLNLLSNAFKFTPDGGTVGCDLARDGKHFVVTVTDSGPGVAPEYRSAVFERFSQIDSSSTRRHGGTGLGLAIVRDFVEVHGGHVSVGDAASGGALFRVELPLRAPEDAQVSKAKEPDASGDETTAQVLDELRIFSGDADAALSADRPRVVVVEDNPDMNRFLRECLQDEWSVETAFDGKAGLESARSSPPDLVVTDIMMPNMSGDQLIREIRSDTTLDAVPILVLSARADEQIRVTLLADGAQDYLVKPFQVEELRARVRNLVTLKRARDVLQEELDVRIGSVETLAREVTQKKRELSTALETARVARDQAELASRAKTKFLGLVSHELRTPLSALLLQLERLERKRNGELSPAQQDIVSRALSSARRLSDLIEMLLNYARIESGRLSVEYEPFDLTDLVTDTMEEMRPAAERKGLTLEHRGDAPLAKVRSDPRIVRLAVINLIANAIKFTRHGQITVTTNQAEDCHQIAVSDSGEGIAPEEQLRIFQPFEQLEATEYKHESGVGLGLSLVQSLTSALGGQIELESEPGKGSTFVLSFPSSPSSMVAPRATGERAGA